MNEFLGYISNNSGKIISLFVQHIELTLVAVALSVIIGVPLGILIARVKCTSKPVLMIANLIQAIPSLAILGFLIPILGIGGAPAILMVILYSLLPIVKNTYTGLTNINPDVLEAAKGIGMTKGQVLTKIQIPLALPVMMAGIRISAVTAVGLMTIAAFIGAGGLGELVYTGIQTVNNNMILAGAVPACILAIIMDFIGGKVEKIVSPSGIKMADGTIKLNRNKKKFSKKIRIISLVVVVSLIGTAIGMSILNSRKETIVVASKNYTEQNILGNIMAELIENKTDLNVERKMNLGGSKVIFSATELGEVDLYVEYTGVALVNILNKTGKYTRDEAYDIVYKEFKEKHGLILLDDLGFNNTYSLAVKKDTADKYGLNTYSDIANISDDLRLGCTLEFAERLDGYVGLKDEYDMNFKDVKGIDGGLRYKAIDNKECEVVDAFTTDGLLKVFDLKVLEDDKDFFPPYYAAPVIREETLEKHPELKEVINLLHGRINEEKMMELNYRVDENGEDPKEVARDFLKEEGLI